MNDNSSLSIYDLFRSFWDWSFENPDLVTPSHCAVFSFAIEHCNRLGWKEKFGFPSQMAMEAVGIKSWHTYSKCFNDLVKWGFFIVHQKSTNQYSANIIAIAKNVKAPVKALDKALQKHGQKQRQYNNTNIQLYNSTNTPPADEPPSPPKFDFKQSLIDLGADEKKVSDFMDARKKKKLANTESALSLFIKEAEKVNMTIAEAVEYCAGRSWGGLRAEYIKGEQAVTLPYLTGAAETAEINKINAITDDFQLQVYLSKIQFNAEYSALYHTELQKFISWDTLIKCPKIGKVARDIFTARSINHLLTPATYGQRNKTA